MLGFFTTIFQLQKLVSKTYRAKGQHLIHQNVFEGKISLVAVVQKSWFSLRNKVFLIFRSKILKRIQNKSEN